MWHMYAHFKMSYSVKLRQFIHFETARLLLAGVGFICSMVACLAVFANDAFYFLHFGLTPSFVLFLVGLVLGGLSGLWGLGLVIALLPLTVGFPTLLTHFFEIKLVVMPNPGLDLVAGYFLAYISKQMITKFDTYKTKSKSLMALIQSTPWPLGLVMLMITASAVLAVSRNLYLSASTSSLRGVLFNLLHFRPIDWVADYLPIGNWVAYAVAVSLIILIISSFKSFNSEQKNAWVFRSLIFGLIISSIAGLTQSYTGWGLPEAQLQFRKDAFGFAAIGMQPDLHAFSAHMLLGVVGIWGYFLFCKSKLEKIFIFLTFLLCSAGLVASKSRASLLIAVISLAMMGLIYCFRHKYCCNKTMV